MYILLLKYCNIRYVFFILCGNKDYYYYYYYYYNHIVSINDSFIFALCSLPLWLHTTSTLMEWNPFRLTKSFSFVLGAWILTCVPSTLPITPGNPPLSWKPSLDYLQFGGRRPQNELFLLLGQSKQHIFHHPWDRGFWQADGVTDGS